MRKINTLVLGIGNLLLQDEGIGIHAVEYLKKKEFPVFVHLLDGGTGGFHLLELFQQFPRIIIIDATLDSNLPGTIRLIKPKYSSDYPKSLSAHDIGLKDLVESSYLLGNQPEIYLIVISISQVQNLEIKLSESLEKKFDQIHSMILNIIET